MPTRRSGPRAPRKRVERTEPPAAPKRAVAEERPVASSGRPTSRNPLFPVGVSLYPLDSESQGTDEWYGRDITEDLDRLAAMKCSLVRLFVSWKQFEPQVGQYNDEAADHLVSMVAAAAERKLQTIVCFFADDRHAELNDVGWGKRRDPRTDTYLIQREVALVSHVVSKLHGQKGVFAWQLGNEAFMAGFESADDLLEWTRLLKDAIREHDAKRPIALGADAETLFMATGVDARETTALCDFVVAHVTSAYKAYAAEGPLGSGPSTYLESFLVRMAGSDKPVLLDDIGPVTLEHSAAEEETHLRLAMWGGLCNRAAGSMARRLHDMETERREPYFLDPYETLVGLMDCDDEPKPVLEDMARFIKTSARIDLQSYSLIAERTGVMVPSERYAHLPNLAGLFGPRACFHSYIAAKRAQVPVKLVPEGSDLSDLQVMIVPSAFNLEESTWDALTAFVQTGGTLLLSFGGGDAHPAIRDLFGMEFLGDGGPRSEFTCRVAQADILGDLHGFDEHFELPNFALLSGAGATIVATDATGSPLLSVNQVGQGRAVFVAVPIERAIAQGDPWATPAVVQHLVREVYGAVARGAGCGAPVCCDAPDVEVALLQGGDDDILVLMNHSGEKVSANLSLERPLLSIADVRGGSPVAANANAFGVPLEPAGVTALRLTYA